MAFKFDAVLIVKLMCVFSVVVTIEWTMNCYMYIYTLFFKNILVIARIFFNILFVYNRYYERYFLGDIVEDELLYQTSKLSGVS